MEGIKKILFCLTVSTLLLNISIVSAQETGKNGPSLRISPAIFDLDLRPGDNVTKEIYVFNESNKDAEIISEVADFSYNQNGQIVFSEEGVENAATTSMKKWMSYPEKEFPLKAGENKKLTFSINVPANAEPGGHYGVMFFKTKPQGEGNVGVSARVGALVLVTLPGNVTKTGSVSNFQVGSIDMKNNITPASFIAKGPVGFSFTILNSGNAHFIPTGNIIITDMWGKQVAEVKPQEARAFPGVPRTYVQSAHFDPWGSYTATLSLKDGDGNPMQVLTVKFWGFNYQLVIQYLILIILIIILLTYGIKQYNRWIISQAMKHHKK